MHTTPSLIRAASLWLLALVLAVVGAVVVVTGVKSSVAGPAQPVHAYLDALRAGDGGRALGLLRAQVPAGSAALLDGAPLKDSMARVEDITVDTPEVDGERARVTVRFTVDGAAQASQFDLEQTGTDWLFFPRWSIVPGPLPTIEATVVNSERADINGTGVNMPGGRNQFPVFFPGSYVASLPGEHFAAEPRAAVVSGHSTPPPLALTTKATPALVSAIDEKVRGFLDKCTKEATDAQRLQPDCPFSFTTNNRIKDGTIAWTVKEYPTVSVEPFEGRWIVAPLYGTARLTATQIDLFTGRTSQLDELLGIQFSARLDITESAITVTPVLG